MSNQFNDLTESGDFRTCDAFKLQPQTPCLFDDAYGSFMKVGPVKMPTFVTPNDVIGPVKMPTFEPSKDVIGPVKMPSFDSPDKSEDSLLMPPCEPIHEAQHESKWDEIKGGVKKWIDGFGPSEEEQWKIIWDAVNHGPHYDANGMIIPKQKDQ